MRSERGAVGGQEEQTCCAHDRGILNYAATGHVMLILYEREATAVLVFFFILGVEVVVLFPVNLSRCIGRVRGWFGLILNVLSNETTHDRELTQDRQASRGNAADRIVFLDCQVDAVWGRGTRRASLELEILQQVYLTALRSGFGSLAGSCST
jgi:hypothetical protein